MTINLDSVLWDHRRGEFKKWRVGRITLGRASLRRWNLR